MAFHTSARTQMSRLPAMIVLMFGRMLPLVQLCQLQVSLPCSQEYVAVHGGYVSSLVNMRKIYFYG
jgi:hypothetical protein